MSNTAEDSEKDHIYTGDNLLETLANSKLLKELQFEEITQTEELDTPCLTPDTPDSNTQSLPCSSLSQ